jgi:hypothetical protein
VQATVHTTDRGDIELPPLYLDEWRKDYGQWLEMPRHKMHVISYRMSIREVYGISIDVRDPDDVRDEYRKAEFRTVEKVESMAAKMDGKFTMPLTVVDDTTPNPEQPTSDAPEMDDEPAAVDESDMIPPPTPFKVRPIIDAPCGFKGCSSMAVARCGECGEWVCAEHLGANGFSCVKHEGGNQ